MVAILPFLLCLQPEVTMTTIRQFSRITLAMLAMTGRVTMLGIARWTGDGGSYRTIQRFFTAVVPWAAVFWIFFRTHLLQRDDVYLLAGDETVVTKAGKHTHGLDRFFAGRYGKPVPGLAFFTLSLISTTQRRSFPIAVEQVLRTPEEKATARAKAALPAAKRKPGRPKGSTTKAKTTVDLSPELSRIQTMIRALLERIGGLLPLTYLVVDGHFGNNHALQMIRQCNLHLISKLRSDSALYLPYTGPYAGRGPRRIYGDKLDLRAMPADALRQTTVAKGIETCIYQLDARHKTVAEPLNVVVIVKTNLTTQAQAHIILFSSDLTLPFATLIDYYGLRFQLEFNFRDAKQYWGLEDFMATHPTAVTNAANLSLFMVNLVERVLQDIRPRHPAISVLDLKAHCRGAKYVEETIKLLPEPPQPIVLERIFTTIVGIGRIHAVPADPVPA
ncbi:MAG: transposase [Chloroflexota bacterium]|nr:transposase [Chloroflexota bacterium]